MWGLVLQEEEERGGEESEVGELKEEKACPKTTRFVFA